MIKRIKRKIKNKIRHIVIGAFMESEFWDTTVRPAVDDFHERSSRSKRAVFDPTKPYTDSQGVKHNV